MTSRNKKIHLKEQSFPYMVNFIALKSVQNHYIYDHLKSKWQMYIFVSVNENTLRHPLHKSLLHEEY